MATTSYTSTVCCSCTNKDVRPGWRYDPSKHKLYVHKGSRFIGIKETETEHSITCLNEETLKNLLKEKSGIGDFWWEPYFQEKADFKTFCISFHIAYKAVADDVGKLEVNEVCEVEYFERVSMLLFTTEKWLQTERLALLIEDLIKSDTVKFNFTCSKVVLRWHNDIMEFASLPSGMNEFRRIVQDLKKSKERITYICLHYIVKKAVETCPRGGDAEAGTADENTASDMLESQSSVAQASKRRNTVINMSACKSDSSDRTSQKESTDDGIASDCAKDVETNELTGQFPAASVSPGACSVCRVAAVKATSKNLAIDKEVSGKHSVAAMSTNTKAGGTSDIKIDSIKDKSASSYKDVLETNKSSVKYGKACDISRNGSYKKHNGFATDAEVSGENPVTGMSEKVKAAKTCEIVTGLSNGKRASSYTDDLGTSDSRIEHDKVTCGSQGPLQGNANKVLPCSSSRDVCTPSKNIHPAVMETKLCGFPKKVYGCGGKSFSSTEERIIVLLGPVGSGKTVMVNLLANYFLGNKTLEEIKYVAGLSCSRGNVTAYTFNTEEEKDYSFTIIDTPGLDDSSSDAICDHVNSFKSFFGNIQRTKTQVHAIGFVLPSHIVRLTPSDRISMDLVKSLFGDACSGNVLPLVTFSDSSKIPPVIEALTFCGLKPDKFFSFNNSALNSLLLGKTEEIDELDKLYWKKGMKNAKSILNLVKTMKPIGVDVVEAVQKKDYIYSFVNDSRVEFKEKLRHFVNKLNQSHLQQVFELRDEIWQSALGKYYMEKEVYKQSFGNMTLYEFIFQYVSEVSREENFMTKRLFSALLFSTKSEFSKEVHSILKSSMARFDSLWRCSTLTGSPKKMCLLCIEKMWEVANAVPNSPFVSKIQLLEEVNKNVSDGQLKEFLSELIKVCPSCK